MTKLAYLGPEGTFTHDAATKAVTIRAKDYVAHTSVAEIIRSVAHGDVAAGVIPIENTVDGEVYSTLEQLALEVGRVQICEEIGLPIRLDLYGLNAKSDPHVLLSHRNAINQCEKFVSEKHMETEEVSSTAEACRQVVARGRADTAAIASAGAAAHYGLFALQENIGDDPNAATRFAVIAATVGDQTGHDRTLFAITAPHVGFRDLRQIVSTFSSNNCEVVRLLVRRIGGENKSTVFLTCRGHVTDVAQKKSVEYLLDQGMQVVCIGSYADDVA